MATVTKATSETAERFEHVSGVNSDKTPWRARRNGKTKTWKKHPERFKIPVKYGLKQCFYIQNFADVDQPANNEEWNVVN